MSTVDIVVIGAGASGMFLALHSACAGHSVTVVDAGAKTLRKVRISGGGKCNCTNLDVQAHNYLSANPHFVKSALARYTPWDFLAWLGEHHIATEEREHGQMFCRDSSLELVRALEGDCERAGARVVTSCPVQAVEKDGETFITRTEQGDMRSRRLVVATGGPSWPEAGATDFATRAAKAFNIRCVPFAPALAPLVFGPAEQHMATSLAGVSLPATLRTTSQQYGPASFTEALLFTHKGISGPVTLQASSYWKCGQELTIDLLPGTDLEAVLREHKTENIHLRTLLSRLLPKRLPPLLLEDPLLSKPVPQLSNKDVEVVVRSLCSWTVEPSRTEGLAKAEACTGGADTAAFSSKTMEAKDVPGLFFVGEALDVAGHLGGYNLHWAWASAHAAATA